MKYLSTVQILLVIVCCFCCWMEASCKSVNSRSANAIRHSERKPFATPELPMISKNFKRFKREILANTNAFQDIVKATKEQCLKDMGFPKEMMNKSFLNEANLSPKEKCLLECIFKRTKIMDSLSNKLSLEQVGRIAETVSNKNLLAISIAMATADKCNRKITAKEPCEAAYQINQAIANEMNAHRINIVY